MKMNQFTKEVLASRREERDFPKEGWEKVDDHGGNLWELNRGWRWNHIITDVKISASGKEIWVKTSAKTR